MFKTLFACIAVTALCCVSANAAVHNLYANLDGPQANAGAGTGSTGTGSATIAYDDGSGMLSWNISWSGLIGTETVMHFHGPALPNQNAGVRVTIDGTGPSSPEIGSANITAAHGAELLNELWYINVHSTRNPGGEIRGQVYNVVPEPASISLLAIGGLTLIRRRRSATV